MRMIQFCTPRCSLNTKTVSSGSMLSIGLHGGELLVGTKRFAERCPRCGKISVWIVEEEPRHANIEAQTETETQI